MADETMTDEQILEGVEHKSFAATSDRTAASLSASGVASSSVSMRMNPITRSVVVGRPALITRSLKKNTR